MTSGAPEASALEEALTIAERQFVEANPKSREHYGRACRVMPGGHTRQTLYFHPFPLTITRGREARLFDLDGHEYLNLVGDYAAGVFGHTCEPIQEAVRSTLRAGVALSGLNTKELELAELISRRMPSIEQVRFCNSGSEACLFAAQLARHATKRQKLLVFNGCYHGGFMIYAATDSSLSVPFPLCKSTYNDLEGARSILQANGADIAAVLVEPMMGAGGCIPATAEFLTMLREETQRVGALLVFDEVMTSRLGPAGVQGIHGIRPDLTTLGKFWGGTFAFGAFGGSRALMQHLDTSAGGNLSQGGTFNNNVIAMTAGLVGARDVYTPDACKRLNALGDWLREELNSLGRSLGLGFQATGIGGVMSTHWHDRPITDPSQVDAPNAPLRRLFQLEMISRGYYVAQRGMINLSLPLDRSDLGGFIQATSEYLDRHANVLDRATN
jgi:glutamate-1-semialdehyde 2,1-aminomutase